MGEFHASEWFRNAVCYTIHAPFPSVRFRAVHEVIVQRDCAFVILENKRASSVMLGQSSNPRE